MSQNESDDPVDSELSRQKLGFKIGKKWSDFSQLKIDFVKRSN